MGIALVTLGVLLFVAGFALAFTIYGEAAFVLGLIALGDAFDLSRPEGSHR